MAGVPIKFRCYQCNQLLGVSRSKVGSSVACPKCATELIVPEPDEGPALGDSPMLNEMPAGAGQAASSDTTPAFLSAMAAGVPVELSELRPEDIRVEPDVLWTPPPAPHAPAPSPAIAPEEYAPTPFAVPMSPTPPMPMAPGPTPVRPPPLPQTQPPPLPQTQPPAPAFVAPPPYQGPVVPSIKVDPPSLVSERTTHVRSRDMVLPRSVVASWSLFVLLAQALAFIAGLLAGHFLWRVH